MMKLARRVGAAIVLIAATVAPAVSSPWREVCVAIVALGAAAGLSATHAAATKAHLAAVQAKDNSDVRA